VSFERIGGEQVWKGRICAVRVEQFRHDDGEVVTRESIEHPGAVVMLPFDANPQLFHQENHFRPDVLLGVGRGDRKIAFLVPDLVSEVARIRPAAFILGGIPDRLVAVDFVIRKVRFVVETQNARVPRS